MSPKPNAGVDEVQLDMLELRIAQLLRGGVLLAGFLLFVGWMGNLHLVGNPFLVFHDYAPVRLSESLSLKLKSPAMWITYAGLFLLVSLPLIRVLFTAVLFWRQGDRLLALIAALVSIALISSFVLGLEI